MTDYSLSLSDTEVARYRFMAQQAQQAEATLWSTAGVEPGAQVADVGCGPAAVSVVLADAVGPDGSVVGVERDESALALARALVDRAGATNVELRQGDADATGLTPASLDLVMLRHVLAHNGGGEQQIVDHLATLVRPGGCVYLVDVDLTASRTLGADPELADLQSRYLDFQAARGNDLSVGLRLGQLLTHAGLELAAFVGQWTILPRPAGVRPPAWAARDAMRDAGFATDADIDRWDAALSRTDTATEVPTLFIPSFVGLGRRPV